MKSTVAHWSLQIPENPDSSRWEWISRRLHLGLPSPEQGERQQARAALQVRDISRDTCSSVVRTQQLCPGAIPTVGLGPALVVSSMSDGLQVASQGVAGLEQDSSGGRKPGGLVKPEGPPISGVRGQCRRWVRA